MNCSVVAGDHIRVFASEWFFELLDLGNLRFTLPIGNEKSGDRTLRLQLRTADHNKNCMLGA
jgi:hypothetical protein